MTKSLYDPEVEKKGIEKGYEEIVLNNIKFKVEEIDKNRVKKVRIFT